MRPHSLFARRCHRLHLCEVRNIGAVSDGLPARSADLLDNLLGGRRGAATPVPGGAKVIHHHLSPSGS